MVEAQTAAARRQSRRHQLDVCADDITRDPRWGRIVEGAGEDLICAAMSRAQVRGFQGDCIGSSEHLFSRQHFRRLRRCRRRARYDAANISDAQLWNVYLPCLRRQLTLVSQA